MEIWKVIFHGNALFYKDNFLLRIIYKNAKTNEYWKL